MVSISREVPVLLSSDWLGMEAKRDQGIIEGKSVMPHVPDQRLDFEGPDILCRRTEGETLAMRMI